MRLGRHYLGLVSNPGYWWKILFSSRTSRFSGKNSYLESRDGREEILNLVSKHEPEGKKFSILSRELKWASRSALLFGFFGSFLGLASVPVCSQTDSFLTVNQWTSMQCSNSCGRHFVLCEALCLIFFWWKMPSVIPSLRLCFATSCPVGGARAQWAVPIVIKPFWLPLALLVRKGLWEALNVGKMAQNCPLLLTSKHI